MGPPLQCGGLNLELKMIKEIYIFINFSIIVVAVFSLDTSTDETKEKPTEHIEKVVPTKQVSKISTANFIQRPDTKLGNMHWKSFYPSGYAKELWAVQFGKKSGLSSTYFDSYLQEVKFRSSYVDGIKNGLEQEYSKEGKLIATRYYMMGQISSEELHEED